MPFLLGVFLFVIIAGFSAFLALDLGRAAVSSNVHMTWVQLALRLFLIGVSAAGSLAVAGSLGWIPIRG